MIRVFITVEGGIVQDVTASEPIEVHVCDLDIEGRDLDDLTMCAGTLAKLAGGDWSRTEADTVAPGAPERGAARALAYFNEAITDDTAGDDAEEHPLDRAEMQDREDKSAGDPRIEDHPFNPRNGSAGDY